MRAGQHGRHRRRPREYQVKRGRGHGAGNASPRAPYSDNVTAPKFPESVLSPATPAGPAPATAAITLYTTAICPYCVAAKNFLRSKGLDWTEVRIDRDPEARARMLELARRTSVPQIFVGDTHVGGYDDMIALHREGRFEPLVAGAA
jgi:glutaredoxin 3